MEQLTPITSSNLRAYGYSAAEKALTIEFNNGTRWRYEGVPPEVAEEFAVADSKGSFFARSIRMAYKGEHIGNAEGDDKQ